MTLSVFLIFFYFFKNCFCLLKNYTFSQFCNYHTIISLLLPLIVFFGHKKFRIFRNFRKRNLIVSGVLRPPCLPSPPWHGNCFPSSHHIQPVFRLDECNFLIRRYNITAFSLFLSPTTFLHNLQQFSLSTKCGSCLVNVSVWIVFPYSAFSVALVLFNDLHLL